MKRTEPVGTTVSMTYAKRKGSTKSMVAPTSFMVRPSAMRGI